MINCMLQAQSTSLLLQKLRELPIKLSKVRKLEIWLWLIIKFLLFCLLQLLTKTCISVPKTLTTQTQMTPTRKKTPEVKSSWTALMMKNCEDFRKWCNASDCSKEKHFTKEKSNQCWGGHECLCSIHLECHAHPTMEFNFHMSLHDLCIQQQVKAHALWDVCT